MTPEIMLTTSRLLLRPITQSDSADVFALRSDPAVTRYTGNTAWSDILSAHKWIDEGIAAMANGQYLRLGLVRHDTGRLIGTSILYHWDEQCRRADIGYDLLPACWGRGYINEALTALIEYGFSNMQLNRIEADVDPLNAASIKTLLRLGFVREGFLRERWIVNGVKADTALYGLLLSDWVAHKDSGNKNA